MRRAGTGQLLHRLLHRHLHFLEVHKLAVASFPRKAFRRGGRLAAAEVLCARGEARYTLSSSARRNSSFFQTAPRSASKRPVEIHHTRSPSYLQPESARHGESCDQGAFAWSMVRQSCSISPQMIYRRTMLPPSSSVESRATHHHRRWRDGVAQPNSA